MREISYDVVIIGAGQAAAPLGFKLSEAGRRVAIVERDHVGGSCVNFGCIPTKAALASARIAHLARRAGEYGVRVPTVAVDFPAVLARAREIVQGSRSGLADSLESSEELDLLRGRARLDGRNASGFRVRIDNDAVSAHQIVLDTGTTTRVPPIAGLDQVDCLKAENWLQRPDLPARLLVLGAGATGLEMAQLYRRMGSEVVVVEASERIAGNEDDDVAAALQSCLEGEGIEFRVATRVAGVERADGALAAKLEGAGNGRLEVDQIFLAAGRRPNTADLGLETVGVDLDDDGFVRVDKGLATGVAGIWAAGDIRGGAMFTHTSWDDHRILLSQMVGDGSRTTERLVPYAILTDPELGRVGVSEREAGEQGLDVEVGTMKMASNKRARATGETAGLIKVVVERESRRILGAAVLAAHGGELVHAYLDLMSAGASCAAILDTIHIHPTFSEALHTVLLSMRS